MSSELPPIESITDDERDARVETLRVAMQGALFHNFRLQNCNVISFMPRVLARGGRVFLPTRTKFLFLRVRNDLGFQKN